MMDYAEKYTAIKELSVDQETLLQWKQDVDFVNWLIQQDGPVSIDGYTIERTNIRSATIIEPDGTVWENIVFSNDTPDTLEGMLNWHRFGPS